jgi:hypothetical protein
MFALLKGGQSPQLLRLLTAQLTRDMAAGTKC